MSSTRYLRPLLVVLLQGTAIACSCDPPPEPDGSAPLTSGDQDHDCISDELEGRNAGVDTDGDGRPDYLDDDSDDDLIADIDEAINPGCVIGSPPVDSDLDGIPDFRDIDSDNDLIADLHERGQDTDGDGLHDPQDLDSDNDEIPDELEAGDNDLSTPPVDSDGDSTPDFRDTDADNDGLSDAWEWSHRDDVGVDFRDQDSDDDQVYDWIEVVAGSDPGDPNDSPLTRGEFVFILPYNDEPEPQVDTLVVSTARQLGDVLFVLDLTRSMNAEIESIRGDLTQIIQDVTCSPGEPPERSDCIKDLWVGVGWFTGIGGSSSEFRALEVDRNLTNDIDSVISAIPTITHDGGNECQRRAAFCAVTGPGAPFCPFVNTINRDQFPCPGPMLGFPCFRPDAARMLVMITDEDMDQDPQPDIETVAAELRALEISFIGINAAAGRDAPVTDDLNELALATGSIDADGEPLVFFGADAAVRDAVSDAIRAATRVPIDVTTHVIGSSEDGVDAADFIEYLEVQVSDDGCTDWLELEDSNGDLHDDTFLGIVPGTPVCWDVRVVRNDIVPPRSEPQMFTATIEIRGGAGGPLLDSREVYFLIPPETFVPPLD